MLMGLAVGEPSLGRVTGDGELDVTPLILAATILLLVKVVLGVRLGWHSALVIVLAAPLLVGLSNQISYPLTLTLILATGGIASAVHRGMDPPRPPS
jgi:hypothetical protein